MKRIMIILLALFSQISYTKEPDIIKSETYAVYETKQKGIYITQLCIQGYLFVITMSNSNSGYSPHIGQTTQVYKPNKDNTGSVPVKCYLENDKLIIEK